MDNTERFRLGAEIMLKAHGIEDPILLNKLCGVFDTTTEAPHTGLREKEEVPYMDDFERGCVSGWNDCIDHLRAQSHTDTEE